MTRRLHTTRHWPLKGGQDRCSPTSLSHCALKGGRRLASAWPPGDPAPQPVGRTHHRLQPGAERGRQPGQQLHAFPALRVQEGVGQPLARQHQQLGGQDLFVVDLEDGLRT